MACGLVNLGSCLPQTFFEFLINIFNAPVQPLLNLIISLLSEPVNLSIFKGAWIIIIYMLSMFYSLLLLGSGFSIMISGHNAERRESAKNWLRNIVIMIILIQSSFFIYQLAIDLSAIMTSASLSLIDTNLFSIGAQNGLDVGTSLLFGLMYLFTLAVTALILIIRYAFIAIGVVLLPLAIFAYFFPPTKYYGSLMLNFLGVAIFIGFIDGIILMGFSKLININLFSGMRILVLTSAFSTINLFMIFLLFFSIIKSGLSAISEVKKIVGLFA